MLVYELAVSQVRASARSPAQVRRACQTRRGDKRAMTLRVNVGDVAQPPSGVEGSGPTRLVPGLEAGLRARRGSPLSESVESRDDVEARARGRRAGQRMSRRHARLLLHRVRQQGHARLVAGGMRHIHWREQAEIRRVDTAPTASRAATAPWACSRTLRYSAVQPRASATSRRAPAGQSDHRFGTITRPPNVGPCGPSGRSVPSQPRQQESVHDA